MIYTVTLNPSMDYVVSLKDFQLGKTNRTEEEQIYAGGKGINVSMQLKNLGFSSVILGFVAGFTGREIRRQLEEKEMLTDFVLLPEGNSRINLKIRNLEGTEINGSGPAISSGYMDELLQKLEGLGEGDLLFLMGSIPGSVSQTIYAQMMKRLEHKGVLVVLDTAGEALRSALFQKPFLIKPNQQELSELFGVKIKTREEVIPYGEKLQKMGARNVLISLAGEGAVLVSEEGKIYQASAPKGTLVNSVGAGDAMVAGFMAGWLEKKDYAHAFYKGLATGSAAAFSEGVAIQQDVQDLYERLKFNKTSCEAI